ncbi:hypothetical protein IQ249_22280 [Lusitaniella coriacea LEGE 07157]|uniref:Uncharacterized protein n=1 Tax=Lusitaniella coriacea LEGE 07157 TaxID=945747 RepID=A0A8J7E169_9CYAN|nr:hypothetical protein [Lusitaniella coriacea]MBE9118621.1 hypothetical protein [Lusitaniella coriacea LEGE 07157]
MTATLPTELTKERVQQAINAILGTLGEPETDLHQKAFTAFQSGDYQAVKRLASTHLSDSYCRSLGYLGSALKLTPNTDTILAESARAAADFTRDRVLERLGDAIGEALN